MRQTRRTCTEARETDVIMMMSPRDCFRNVLTQTVFCCCCFWLVVLLWKPARGNDNKDTGIYRRSASFKNPAVQLTQSGGAPLRGYSGGGTNVSSNRPQRTAGAVSCTSRHRPLRVWLFISYSKYATKQQKMQVSSSRFWPRVDRGETFTSSPPCKNEFFFVFFFFFFFVFFFLS